jgi:hypothetical protein
MQNFRLEVVYAAYASTPGYNENNPWIIRQGNGIDLAFAGAKQHDGRHLEDTKTLRAAVEWAGAQRLLVQWVEHGRPTELLAESEEFFDIERLGERRREAKKAYARNTANIQVLGEAAPRIIEVLFYQSYESLGAGYNPKTFGKGWIVTDTGRISLPADLGELPAPRTAWRQEEAAQ